MTSECMVSLLLYCILHSISFCSYLIKEDHYPVNGVYAFSWWRELRSCKILVTDKRLHRLAFMCPLNNLVLLQIVLYISESVFSCFGLYILASGVVQTFHNWFTLDLIKTIVTSQLQIAFYKYLLSSIRGFPFWQWEVRYK